MAKSSPEEKRQKKRQMHRFLDELFVQAPAVELSEARKLVIVSDLHMGDGGSNDDFQSNASLFQTIMEHHYLAQGYELVLNGDIEELQRFSLDRIRQRWAAVFELFSCFERETALYKTIGNHDMSLLNVPLEERRYDLMHSLKLTFKDHHLLVFHGHQVSKKYQRNNDLIGLTLKYVANPLGIKNYSVAHSSKKQFRIEKKVYEYSRENKIVSIIGHTHRPLFESPMTRTEWLKYHIEQLCREYVHHANGNARDIEEQIQQYSKKLKKLHRKHVATEISKSIYSNLFYIPCLFNSGCVMGNQGITAIEIEGGEIRLVHWFDEPLRQKYVALNGYEPEPLDSTGYFRYALNQELLDYVFARIQFLA